jgi:hypothetical protein
MEIFMVGDKSGMLTKPGQSDKTKQQFASVTSGRPRNVDLVPIDYGSGLVTLRVAPHG